MGCCCEYATAEHFFNNGIVVLGSYSGLGPGFQASINAAANVIQRSYVCCQVRSELDSASMELGRVVVGLPVVGLP